MKDNNKVALLTGINGQDGSYLAEFLLDKGYEVWGVIKRNSVSENQTARIDHIMDRIHLEYGDMTDMASLIKVLVKAKPTEIYNLAAQSHVRISFDQPVYTANATGLGVLNLLEAIRIACPDAKLYQASSSEMFGNNIDPDGFQRETTPLSPVSPYGCFPPKTSILFFDKSVNKIGKNTVLGKIKNKDIKDIKVGDEVLSYNTETGVKEYKKVISTMDRDTNELYLIGFSNGNFIECTEEHPIYVHGKEWVEAKNLVIGDKCIQYKYSGLNSRCRLNKTYNEVYGDTVAKKIKRLQSIGIKEAWKVSEKLDKKKYANAFSDRRKRFEVWNKGLTKKTSSTVKLISDKNIGRRLTESQKKHLSLRSKELWINNEYISKQINSRNTFPNKHERKLINILDDICPNNFDYNGGFEKGIMIDRKIPDFVHKTKNKLIEYFGEYWHTKEYKDTEEELILKYKANGYECLVIWENDLFNESKKTEKRILDFIYNENTEVVDVISIEKINKPSKVYNFEVEDNNNYYAHGILVHNCAKVYGYNICRNYRNSYGMFISNGILFNHESSRRGINFVTNKVVKVAVEISLGLKDELVLGNLEATRDWGHAKDYVKAMWLILQHDKPDDFVCATGISHSVQDLVEYVFEKLGLDWEDHVRCDPKFLRPEELRDLKGDAIKLKERLGWEAEYTFESMLDEMIEYWVDHYTSDL